MFYFVLFCFVFFFKLHFTFYIYAQRVLFKKEKLFKVKKWPTKKNYLEILFISLRLNLNPRLFGHTAYTQFF